MPFQAFTPPVPTIDFGLIQIVGKTFSLANGVDNSFDLVGMDIIGGDGLLEVWAGDTHYLRNIGTAGMMMALTLRVQPILAGTFVRFNPQSPAEDWYIEPTGGPADNHYLGKPFVLPVAELCSFGAIQTGSGINLNGTLAGFAYPLVNNRA